MNLFNKLFGKKPKEEVVQNEENISVDEKVTSQESEKRVEEIHEKVSEEQEVQEEVKEVIKEEIKEVKEEKTIVEPIIEEPKVEVSKPEVKHLEKKEEPVKKVVTPEEEPPTQAGLFKKLKQGLDKTRKNLLGSVDSVLKAFTKVDEELLEELEEALIMSDIGVNTTMLLMDKLREQIKKQKVTEPSKVKDLLIQIISELLNDETEMEETAEGPMILLVVGVNGVGKTTTIGKLGHMFKSQKKSVLLAAADTFRAAAIDQLQIWGERIGVDVIHQSEGSDPAAVIFDSIQAAKARKTDVLICDTAGRLHNKKNLMEELKKVFRVVDREYPNAKKEVILVLDATTGQNALQQAKLFQEACNLTGLILTKLDGTAKGGMILAIKAELNIPVYFVGVGEGIYDLQPFDSKEFAKALFSE